MPGGKGSARIPVSLVTGFLGSGKTTLIRALLRQPAMAGSAIIVNEFGEVGIDDAIFAEALDGDDVVLLANGCLCCAAGDDLADAVWRLSRRTADRPRRIIVETSGLADPAPSLRRMMSDPRIRQTIRLDALVATVDAINGLATLESESVAQRQCAVADRRLITKTDLVDRATVKALEEQLLHLNPGAPVGHAAHGEVPAETLFGATLFDAETSRADPDRWLGRDGFRRIPGSDVDGSIRFSGRPAHDPRVGTWLIENPAPLDWTKLSSKLGDVIARYGNRILRIKGVIHTRDDARPLVIHGVQRVFHTPVRLRSWDRDPATSIVVIGDRDARPAVEAIEVAVHNASGSESKDRAGLAVAVSA